jgi:hypothetical protein
LNQNTQKIRKKITLCSEDLQQERAHKIPINNYRNGISNAHCGNKFG